MVIQTIRLLVFSSNFLFRILASSLQNVSESVGKIKSNPKRLLMSKWTAVETRDKEKHFLVTKVIDPEDPKRLIEFVQVEAVLHSSLIYD